MEGFCLLSQNLSKTLSSPPMAVSGLLPRIHSFPSTYQPLRVASRSPKSPFPNGGFATRLAVKAEAKAKAKAKTKTKTKTTSTATATSVFEDTHTVNIAEDVTQVLNLTFFLLLFFFFSLDVDFPAFSCKPKGEFFSPLSVEDGITLKACLVICFQKTVFENIFWKLAIFRKRA